MRVKKKFQGRSPYRYRGNPLEKEFALRWQIENDRNSRGVLDYLLHSSPVDNFFPDYATPEEHKVASTVIQWLGSNVGQAFLSSVLNTKEGTKFLHDYLLYGRAPCLTQKQLLKRLRIEHPEKSSLILRLLG